MRESIILQCGRWGSPELHRHFLMPDDDDPYFKKVGGVVFGDDRFFKILVLSVFFLFWIFASLGKDPPVSPRQKPISSALFIRKLTLLLLATGLLIAFLDFETSIDWPSFSIRPPFLNLLSAL